MVTTDPLSRIRAFRERRGLKKATLAQLAGLSPNALRDMDQEDWEPRYSTIKRLLSFIEDKEEAEAAAAEPKDAAA